MHPTTLLYTKSHEWIEASGDTRRLGISDHAQQMLGDIVYVEMPQVGKVVEMGDEVLTLESPKAAASIYAPVSGEIVEVNSELEMAPDLINREPGGGGWIVRIRPSKFEKEKGSLLDQDAYQKVVEEGE